VYFFIFSEKWGVAFYIDVMSMPCPKMGRQLPPQTSPCPSPIPGSAAPGYITPESAEEFEEKMKEWGDRDTEWNAVKVQISIGCLYACCCFGSFSRLFTSELIVIGCFVSSFIPLVVISLQPEV